MTTYTPPPLTADEQRQRDTRYLRAGGPVSYRQRVMTIIQPLLKRKLTHETIAQHLTATNVARYNGAFGWQATSVKALLKQHTSDLADATAKRERYLARPKGAERAAQILSGGIHHRDYIPPSRQHNSNYRTTTP
jgi:hypothetical protein